MVSRSVIERDRALVRRCLARDEAALREFMHHRLAPVLPVIRRVAGIEAADASAELTRLLLVGGDAGPPLLERYEGRSKLSTWLHSVAFRFGRRYAAQARRAHRVREAVRDAWSTGEACTTTNDALGSYRSFFPVAFRASVSRLEPDHRKLLERRFVDGLNIDALAVLMQVHRSTVARRLVTAREALHDHLQAVYVERFGLSASTARLVLIELQDRISISLSALRGGS